MDPNDVRRVASSYKSREPLIFKKNLKWKILNWNLEDWKAVFKDDKLSFRKIPFVKSEEPIWENQCDRIMLTLNEFIKFQNGSPHDQLDQNYALYFDYKYMKDYFHNIPEFLEEIKWSDLGYDISGNESTIWIGSHGSHTLCHQDTYGYNLIAQIYGRKEWLLFPPETDLCPTRVPYEESTVFSKVNFFYPNETIRNVEGARRIVLEPGDVLFLPHGWWHYVENLDTAISINTWIPILETDTRKRIEEGLISVFIQSLVKNLQRDDYHKNVLNPNSEFLIGEDVSEMFSILEKTVLELNKMRTETKIGDAVDVDEILKNNVKYVNVVDFLSQDDFESLLRAKLNRYNFVIDNRNLIRNKDFLLENIINSFCKPDNISRVAEEFIKKTCR